MNRKEYLKKWREDNKQHIQNYKKEYAKNHDSSFKKLQDKCKQLQQENKQLKTDMEVLFNENSNKEKVIIKQNDNWNKLKEFLKNTRKENLEWDKEHNCEWKGYNAYSELLNKMQELEKGSDSNVKD